MNDRSPKKIRIITKEHGNLDAEIYIDGEKISTIAEVSMIMKPGIDNMFPTLNIKRLLTPKILREQGTFKKSFREMCEVEIIFKKALVRFQEDVLETE